ncbi:MFS transporter [Cupriavidus basilensis]
MPLLTREIGISVSDFTIAIAVQNLAWGLLQPLAGAWATRVGFRPLMMSGSLLYVLGLVLLATAHGIVGVTLGAGVAIGASMACTGSAISMAVAARPVPAALRSTVLGIVPGAGSLGALVAAPDRANGGAILRLARGPGGLCCAGAGDAAGRVACRQGGSPAAAPRRRAACSKTRARRLAPALRHKAFLVMGAAYFVCGMQLVFLTTHLPPYLDVCGMDPMLSAKALGVIGGFNVLGSLFFGWAGGRVNKLMLLGTIYTVPLALTWYFFVRAHARQHAGVRRGDGFPVAGRGTAGGGLIAETFGLRWQAMLGGVAFFSHQIGSFVGAFGGGWSTMLLGLLYSGRGKSARRWDCPRD